jgi:hypothetical protein
MMPMLAFPSGTYGSSDVLIAPYQYLQADGTILNIGLASTGNMVQHKPTDNQAIMGLVYVDTVTGNPGFIINSGTPFAESITGTFAIAPYIPAMTDPDNLLVAGIRLVSGTTSIGWDNIYDLRQWFTLPPTGSSSGISDHEALTGLLGGSANNHWHLTPSQLSGLASGTVTSLHSHATGTILHNSLTDLQGGTAGNYWHLNSAQIIGLVSGTSTSLHSHSGTGITSVAWGDITGNISDQTDLQAVISGLSSGTASELSYLITEDLTSQITGTGSHFDLTWQALAKCSVYCNLRQLPSDVTMDTTMLGFTLSYTPTTADKLIVDYYIASPNSYFLFDDSGVLIVDDNGDFILEA